MKLEQYNQLKKVIQESNPDIMELTYGCVVEITDWYDNEFIKPFIKDIKWIGREEENIKGSVFYMEWVWVLSDNQFFGSKDLEYAKKYPNCCDNSKKIKILGRPIRLSDILNTDDKLVGYYISKGGKIKFITDESESWIWNLKDDNLDSQSDETKEYLYKLLIK